MHRLWKDRLVEKLRPRPGQRHLDVAGGTGDVAFRVLQAMQQAQHGRSVDTYGGSISFVSTSSGGPVAPAAGAAEPAAAGGTSEASRIHAQTVQQQQQHAAQQPLPSRQGFAAAAELPPVTVCDINASMLEEGRRRAVAAGIGPESMQWVEGNAEVLPFPDAAFDSYTIAFGIRNVTNREAALREAHRQVAGLCCLLGLCILHLLLLLGLSSEMFNLAVHLLHVSTQASGTLGSHIMLVKLSLQRRRQAYHCGVASVGC
jgi:2-methoxy-6-polyprenyl-1,4-benzoquinol methylase